MKSAKLAIAPAIRGLFNTGMACALLALATSASPAWAQAPDLSKMDVVLKSVPDGPVALVNGQPIPARDYTELYMREVTRLEKRGQIANDAQRVQIGIQVLGQLIESEVLYQEAQRRKLTIPEDELQQAWQKEMAYMKEQLADGNANMSDDEILKKAETTRDAAMAELRRILLIDKAAQAIVKEKNVAVADADVAKFIKENEARFDGSSKYHIKHILIKAVPTRGTVTPEEKARAKQKAETALKTIRAGRSFDSVAKEVSEGPRKEQGGDLGMLSTSEMPPFVAAAVEKMQPGQISDVIESEAGYHIVQLIESQPGGQIDPEKLKPRIKDALAREKGQQVIKDFVRVATEKPGVLSVYLRLPERYANVPAPQPAAPAPAPR